MRVYGHQNWWPADSPFEVCIGAVLTQNTSWTNVERAIKRLKDSIALEPAQLERLGPSKLEELIRSSGFYRQKARRLLAFSRFLLENFNGDVLKLTNGPVEEVRRRLLQLEGIGDETADAIMLYVGEIPVFVADSYSRRILSRLGLVSGKSGYGEVRSFVEQEAGKDPVLLNELHALLVQFSKDKCRSSPLCPECFLLDKCPTGRGNLKI